MKTPEYTGSFICVPDLQKKDAELLEGIRAMPPLHAGPALKWILAHPGVAAFLLRQMMLKHLVKFDQDTLKFSGLPISDEEIMLLAHDEKVIAFVGETDGDLFSTIAGRALPPFGSLDLTREELSQSLSRLVSAGRVQRLGKWPRARYLLPTKPPAKP